MTDNHDEHAAIAEVLRIRDEQGWDEDTLLSFYEAFVAKAGLTPLFARYVADAQVAENRSSALELDRMRHLKDATAVEYPTEEMVNDWNIHNDHAQGNEEDA